MRISIFYLEGENAKWAKQFKNYFTELSKLPLGRKIEFTVGTEEFECHLNQTENEKPRLAIRSKSRWWFYSEVDEDNIQICDDYCRITASSPRTDVLCYIWVELLHLTRLDGFIYYQCVEGDLYTNDLEHKYLDQDGYPPYYIVNTDGNVHMEYQYVDDTKGL